MLLRAFAAVCVVSSSATADVTSADVYTSEQAAAGKTPYARECALCHGDSLEGGEAGGALASKAFREKWQGAQLRTLFDLMRFSMPIDTPGALSETEYLNIVAYILNRNGYQPGAVALTTDALSDITIVPPLTSTVAELASVTPTDTSMTEWLHHRGDAGSQNYSPLALINKDNVEDLGVAWRWKSDNFGPDNYPNMQTTPIMADGVLYATAGSRRDVVAIDAATGETLWMYRIDEGVRGDNAPRKGPGRGVAFWRDGKMSRLYLITPGYQLVALDAHTGHPVAGFGDGGIVDLKAALDPSMDLDTSRIGASSPPIIVGNAVIVGAAFPAGAAPPTMTMPKGNVSAYDLHTGKQLWVFNTIPQPGEFGHDTWQDKSWTYTGNTGVWAPMSADPKLGYVYLPVEAPTGDFYGGHRPGDNLFSQSLVCLDARTGKRVWHFQTVHHGIWDYDTTAPPVLIDVEHDGVIVPAVAQVTKQGFVFVFDRRDGTPLWPIEERPAPASDVPRERSAATQPFPTLPEPFARQGVTPESLNNLTPEIHAEALRLAADYRSGPLYTPPSAITDSNQGTLFAPSAAGGANWQGAVADPITGVLYVPATNTIGIAALEPAPERSDMNYVARRLSYLKPFGLPLARAPWGTITAIDLKTGKHLWQIANGDTPDYVKNHPKLQGIDIPRTGHDDRAGLLVTATLLFAGEGAGLYVATEGGTKFRAHDKATGEILAELDLGSRQSGIPMTYAINGRQFIVVAVGAPGQAGEFVALALKQ